MSNKFFTLLVIFSSLLAPSQVFANEVKMCCSDSIIIIDPLPEIHPGTGPRAPALVPISASYEAMLSTLFLAFTYNLGEIEVTTSSCSPSRQVNGTRANSTLIRHFHFFQKSMQDF